MAGNVVQTLVTELTADGAQMRAEIESTLRATNSWGSRMMGIARTVGSGLAAGLAAGTAGLAVMVKSSIDSADELSKLSQQVIFSTEALSKLKYAGEMSDVSLESLGVGLKKFSTNIVAAASGTGEQAEAFERLGITLKNSDGSMKAMDVLLNEVADKFSKYEDGVNKTAIAQQLFGKSGAELIPMLNAGAQGLKDAGDEAERFGLVVSTSTGKAAEEFNDNVTRLGKAFEGVGNLVAAEVVPTLAEFTSVIQDPETQKSFASIAAGIVSIGAAAADALVELTKFGAFLGEELGRTIDGPMADDIAGLEDRLIQLQAQVDPKNFMDWMENSNMGDMFTGKGKLLQEIDLIKKQIAEAYEAQVKLSSTPTPPPVAPSSEGNGKLSDELLAKQAEARATQKQFAEQQKKIAEETAEQFELALKKEDEFNKENERLIEAQKKKFDRIYELSLQADKKDVELENFRYLRLQQEMNAEVELFRERGLLTAEIEKQFQLAREQEKHTHEQKIKDIEEAAEKEQQKKEADGYINLLSLAETYNNSKQGHINKSLAVALHAGKMLLDSEKRSALKQVLLDGKVAIMKAWASAPFPLNVPSVALATGATVANAAAVTGIAHGGIDNVPKESTYLLDKGERVLSPKQNRDITDFIERRDQTGATNVIVKNYGSDKVDVKSNGNSVEIIVGLVMNKFNDQISRGNGISQTLQSTFGLTRRGMV